MLEDKEQEIIKTILSHATARKAPADLSSRIFATWKSQASIAVSYPPLIPLWVWWLLGIFISAMLLWIFLQAPPPSEISILPSLKQLTANADFHFLTINPVMITAVAILGIMMFCNAFFINIRYRHLDINPML